MIANREEVGAKCLDGRAAAPVHIPCPIVNLVLGVVAIGVFEGPASGHGVHKESAIADVIKLSILPCRRSRYRAAPVVILEFSGNHADADRTASRRIE